MKSEKLYLDEEIRKIITKTPKERGGIDNEKLLIKYQSLSYFNDLINSHQYGQLMVSTIMRDIIFREYSRNEVIFKKDELIQSIFIIFEGSVNLYKIPLIRSKPFPRRYSGSDKKIEAVFNKGEMIGGNLILVDKKRASLCETNTNCLIGILPETAYIAIFKNTEGLEKINVNSFISSLPFFAKIKSSISEKIQKKLIKKDISKGDFLFKQGDIFDTIYIIRRGSFLVSFKSSVQYFTYFDMNCFFELYKDLNERFSSNQNFELNNSYKELKEYKLLNLCTGEYLGHIEYKLHAISYLFTVECISDKSQVFAISTKDFEKELTPHCKQILSEEVMKKMTIYQERIKEIKDSTIQKRPGNKYKSVILGKMKKKDEKLKQKIVEVNKESTCKNPIFAIKKAKNHPKFKEIWDSLKLSEKSRSSYQADYNQTDYTNNHFFNHDSIITNESHRNSRPSLKINFNNLDHRMTLPSTTLTKNTIINKDFYRPQTAKISNYNDLNHKQTIAKNTHTRDSMSTLEKTNYKKKLLRDGQSYKGINTQLFLKNNVNIIGKYNNLFKYSLSNSQYSMG